MRPLAPPGLPPEPWVVWVQRGDHSPWEEFAKVTISERAVQQATDLLAVMMDVGFPGCRVRWVRPGVRPEDTEDDGPL